jgi:hypothetical protein
MSEERRVQGQVGKEGGSGAEMFSDKVKVAKSDEKGLGRIAEREFNG